MTGGRRTPTPVPITMPYTATVLVSAAGQDVGTWANTGIQVVIVLAYCIAIVLGFTLSLVVFK